MEMVQRSVVFLVLLLALLVSCNNAEMLDFGFGDFGFFGNDNFPLWCLGGVPCGQLMFYGMLFH